jgi:hypothetical protein
MHVDVLTAVWGEHGATDLICTGALAVGRAENAVSPRSFVSSKMTGQGQEFVRPAYEQCQNILI